MIENLLLTLSGRTDRIQTPDWPVPSIVVSTIAVLVRATPLTRTRSAPARIVALPDRLKRDLPMTFRPIALLVIASALTAVPSIDRPRTPRPEPLYPKTP